MRVVIVGGGICGLTLALELKRRSIDCCVYEAAPEIKPLGVGISLLPHGTKVLVELDLLPTLRQVAVEFKESCFFNSFGQLILRDPANSSWPQFLIHRSDLHQLLLDAVRERLGPDRVILDHLCTGADQDGRGATAHFRSTAKGESLPSAQGDVVIGCDGIHSVFRKHFYPSEGEPVFSGINLWRGVTRHPPILSGGTHVRAGTLDTGKLVVYPIRNDIDAEGRQLLNWLTEIRQPDAVPAEWNRPGRLEDFEHLFADWHFDWLDVPQMLRDADVVLEYPMSDRDPLPRWSFDRITLAGDAAHAMLPRGSNGAMQAILDARCLADQLAMQRDWPAALRRYENERLPAANRVVLTNRTTPPDFLIHMVQERTEHQPFTRLEDVITEDELRGVLERYKQISGYSEEKLLAGAAGRPVEEGEFPL